MFWVLIYIATKFLAPIPLISLGIDDFSSQFPPKSMNSSRRNFSKKSEPAKAGPKPAKAGPCFPQLVNAFSIAHLAPPSISSARPSTAPATQLPRARGSNLYPPSTAHPAPLPRTPLLFPPSSQPPLHLAASLLGQTCSMWPRLASASTCPSSPAAHCPTAQLLGRYTRPRLADHRGPSVTSCSPRVHAPPSSQRHRPASDSPLACSSGHPPRRLLPARFRRASSTASKRLDIDRLKPAVTPAKAGIHLPTSAGSVWTPF
jgi:hypothetical protein